MSEIEDVIMAFQVILNAEPQTICGWLVQKTEPIPGLTNPKF